MLYILFNSSSLVNNQTQIPKTITFGDHTSLYHNFINILNAIITEVALNLSYFYSTYNYGSKLEFKI